SRAGETFAGRWCVARAVPPVARDLRIETDIFPRPRIDLQRGLLRARGTGSLGSAAPKRGLSDRGSRGWGRVAEIDGDRGVSFCPKGSSGRRSLVVGLAPVPVNGARLGLEGGSRSEAFAGARHVACGATAQGHRRGLLRADAQALAHCV